MDGSVLVGAGCLVAKDPYCLWQAYEVGSSQFDIGCVTTCVQCVPPLYALYFVLGISLSCPHFRENSPCTKFYLSLYFNPSMSNTNDEVTMRAEKGPSLQDVLAAIATSSSREDILAAEQEERLM